MPVWVVEAHEVPLVQVNLLLKAGSSDDPAGKFGLASLTAAMLDEGAGSRSALEIADEIDFLGADLATTQLLRCLRGAPQRAGRSSERRRLRVMADVALRPTFPDAELERVRQERLTRSAAGAGRCGDGGAAGVRARRCSGRRIDTERAQSAQPRRSRTSRQRI